MKVIPVKVIFQKKNAFLIFCILLIIQPFFGFLAMSLFIFSFNIKNIFISFYLIVSTLFVSLLASLKYPVTDLKFYIAQFHTYGKYSFTEFYEAIYKDHLFYIINKILYLVGCSSQFFTFFWAFVFYGLILRSMYLLFKNKLIDKEQLILVTLFIVLSVEYLHLSTHLIRQFVASALLVYFITTVMISKTSYIALLSLAFIHFSSIIFILMYPILKHKLSFSSLALLGILFLFLFNMNIEYLNIFQFNIGILDVIVHRASTAGTINIDDGAVSYKMYVISVLLLIILFWLIYKKNNSLYALLFNYILFSFIIVLVTIDIPLISLRFSFYQYPFYILAYTIIIREFISNIKLKFLLLCILLLYALRLYLYFENHLWISNHHYVQIIFNNLFFYIGAI